MFFAIDIGNTNITLGVINDNSIVFSSHISTDKSKTPDEYAIKFMNLFKLYNLSTSIIDGCAISSVVPELSNFIKKAIKKVFSIEPLIIDSKTKTNMKILIDHPSQLGADLIAGCVGAIKLYSLPCLVIDLGTASKISVIDKEGNFRGCAIAPGIGISLNALSSMTSQLPTISLKTPSHSIGTNTIDSMQSGTVFGFASMIDGLCVKLEEELNEGKVTCVATGGLSEDIISSCESNIICNRDLLLYGLKEIYDINFND